MKDENAYPDPDADCLNAHLLGIGLEGLGGFLNERAELDRALASLEEIGDENVRSGARMLRRKLDAVEPSITMIGQVKAGKTSLVNAMMGRPGLLPADVNPWTSVVTSLHLDPDAATAESGARFRFFGEEEWQRLLDHGGRVGELAARAGADEELEKVRAQIEAMREKSRNRLGNRFELLLGQEHEYDSFDEELIERYVCLGDDFGDEAPDGTADDQQQGRFADITKSADLYMHRPEFPMKLCIRDTPGVNDTFLMREQITIRAIRDSRICVVVLSAHQALSTVDMALIRLIANIRSRDVVIFVNRVDELSDPATQIPEIRDSIRATLKAHGGPTDAQIVFGSAFWALSALQGTLNRLPDESIRALLNWAEQELRTTREDESALEYVWRLSGLPALYEAVAQRICEGVGREAIDRVARSTRNLARGVQAARLTLVKTGGRLTLAMDAPALEGAFDRLEAAERARLDAALDAEIPAYHARLDRAHRSFLERATASLIGHLEEKGEAEVWVYEPTGLRLLLRSAYQVFGAKVQRATRAAFDATAGELAALYGRAFGAPEGFRIEPPAAAHVPPPVAIGQTIALDMKGNWWSNWWKRRRGYHSYAASFNAMIKAETDPIVSDLKEVQTAAMRSAAHAALEAFLAEQRSLLLGFATEAAGGGADAAETFGSAETETRLKAIEDTLATLDRRAA
jgi:hypothetical protein